MPSIAAVPNPDGTITSISTNDWANLADYPVVTDPGYPPGVDVP